MQLDNIRIAIRERDLLDILDLSLRVVRSHAMPLILASLAGCLPVAVFNAWLLSDVAARIDLDVDAPWGYFGRMLMLYFWLIPLATAPVTLLLGQVLFQQQPDARRIAAEFWQSLPQLMLFQLIVRGLLTVPVVTWLFPLMGWPYLNEVILLERNRLRRRTGQGLSTYRRSKALHSGSSGDFFARWIASVLVGVGLIAALWLTLWFVRISLWSDVTFDREMYTFYLPIALWTVASYFAVVRFLSYLDLRIRREGWEIELRLRAEAAKLVRQAA